MRSPLHLNFQALLLNKSVSPAKARAHNRRCSQACKVPAAGAVLGLRGLCLWIPAFAGMTSWGGKTGEAKSDYVESFPHLIYKI
jgi:hypothetical protein